jgi:hypothetical protein
MVEHALNRRTLVLSGAAAMAALNLSLRSGLAAPVIQSGGGIAGGGSVQADGGPAEFSVFGSRFVTETEETVFVGALSYLDVVAKTTIESTAISAYGPVEGNEATMRQMSGTCTVNGKGAHPFNLILTDSGPIGSGADVFDLAVGADGATEVGDAIYEVQSAVQAGNLQLIEFPFTEAGVASPTPAG